MSRTDTLTTYIDQYDTELSRRAVGCSERELRRFESELPAPLSEAHREFLLAFGENDGGLFEADGFDTSLATIQAYSRDYQNDYGEDFLRRFDVFASSPAVEAVAIERGEVGHEPVVFMANDHRHPTWSPLADSLPTLCFGTAFIREMKLRFGRCLMTRGPASCASSLRDHLRSEKVSEESFSDSISWYGRRGRETLVAAVRETAAPYISIYLCGASASSLSRMLAGELQLTEPRPSAFA